MKFKKAWLLPVVLTVAAASVFAADSRELDSLAKSLANRVKPYLPLKSGNTTLFEVNQSTGVLVYEHTLDIAYPPENELMIKDWLRAQSYRSACSVQELAAFVRKGGNLHYRFFYNSALLHSVRIDGC
jgi:hypothetical protein